MPECHLGSPAAATADIKSLHNVYLTPQHKRKGKGGRQPAGDPRLDPNMDPKRAKRILNNRLSAARSKAKQRTAQDVGPCWFRRMVSQWGCTSGLGCKQGVLQPALQLVSLAWPACSLEGCSGALQRSHVPGVGCCLHMEDISLAQRSSAAHTASTRLSALSLKWLTGMPLCKASAAVQQHRHQAGPAAGVIILNAWKVWMFGTADTTVTCAACQAP